MITYEPKEKQVEFEENIIINGKVVGTIRPYTPTYPERQKERFQASFPLPGLGLTSGFGETRQEAIAEALAKGIENADNTVGLIHKIRRGMEG